MNIVVNSGKNRRVFEISALKSKKDVGTKVAREQAAEDLKAFLFRPQTLGVRKNG